MNEKSSLLLHDEAECIYAHVDEEINNNPECKALETENRKLGREMMELLGPNRTLQNRAKGNVLPRTAYQNADQKINKHFKHLIQ